MPKPALKSQTVRWNLGGMAVGVLTSIVGFVVLPANMDKIHQTAKIWGVELPFQLIIGVGGIVTAFANGKSIQGRHKIEGAEAIYTPDWLPIGRNLSDLGKTIGIGDVFQAISETKDIAQAKTGQEQLTELVDAVTKLKNTVDVRLGKIERSQPILDDQDLAELPNSPPASVLRRLARENTDSSSALHYARKDAPQPQIEMESVEINNDVIGASDGVLENY